LRLYGQRASLSGRTNHWNNVLCMQAVAQICGKPITKTAEGDISRDDELCSQRK
jgi:hypothetical protein